MASGLIKRACIISLKTPGQSVEAWGQLNIRGFQEVEQELTHEPGEDAPQLHRSRGSLPGLSLYMLLVYIL